MGQRAHPFRSEAPIGRLRSTAVVFSSLFPRVAASVLSLLALAGCSGDDDGDAGGNSSGLRPADEATEDANRDASIDGRIGEFVELDGLRLKVEEIRYLEDVEDDGTGSDFRIVLTVRSENPTDETLSNPDISVICGNTDETGSWYADSTFELYKELPPGTFDEGELVLGMPTGCEDPIIRAQMNGMFMEGDEPPDADWVVPEGALAP